MAQNKEKRLLLKIKISQEKYAKTFSVRKTLKDGVMKYQNPSANNWHELPMDELSDYIKEVGGFKVITTLTFQTAPSDVLPEDLWWWWKLKRKVFQAAIPDLAFGTKSVWKKDLKQITLIVERTCQPRSGSRPDSDTESDTESDADLEPHTQKQPCLQASTSTSPLTTTAPQSSHAQYAIAGSLLMEIDYLCQAVTNVTEDLSNDVGKMLFVSLLKYALSSRLSRETGELIEGSAHQVWHSTATNVNQLCSLVATAEFDDGVETKFASIADITVSSSKGTRIIGEIKSARDMKHSGEGQLGAHLLLALASSKVPTTMLGFLASPVEINVFHGHRTDDTITIKPTTVFKKTQSSATLLEFLFFCYAFLNT